MKLENIGFYTLDDNRAKHCSYKSQLWRCELILTDRCNFNCPYCRGMKKEDKGDISFLDACEIVEKWASNGLKNIRFSGGEPTMWKGLTGLVAHAKMHGIERIAVSTNGTADYEMYRKLIYFGVNDFSISLDSCCSLSGKKMSGGVDAFEKITENIKRLSAKTYVTVGIVLTEENYNDINNIIFFASSLGVADIRVIPAAQISKQLEQLKIDSSLLDKHKILNYRYNNFLSGRNVRGLLESDNKKCPLVLDDMAVLNGKHYPCIIYMREHGKAIGNTSCGINDIRKSRLDWYNNHDCSKDKICKNNCLDVCVDYNNRVAEYNS